MSLRNILNIEPKVTETYSTNSYVNKFIKIRFFFLISDIFFYAVLAIFRIILVSMRQKNPYVSYNLSDIMN